MRKAICLWTIVMSSTLSAHASKPTAASTNRHERLEKYRRPTEKPPIPDDNPENKDVYNLGRKLFFDPMLSINNKMSCETCHNAKHGFEDGETVSIGTTGIRQPRHSQTILDSAYLPLLNWDGRSASLEEQAIGPIKNKIEMMLPIETLVQRLTEHPSYKKEFQKAFAQDKDPISEKNIGKAIANYERYFVSGEAPFDRWAKGNEKAISEKAKLGFDLFDDKARCSRCHNTWRFTDDSFQDIGLKAGDDIGRGKFVKTLMYAFKTPTLRNVKERAPYMHDGSIKTLREVVEHYNTGGIVRPSLSTEIKPLHLSKAEIDALVSFMESLSGRLAAPPPK